MRPYFEKMPGFGKPLKENRIARTQESRAKLEAVEAEIAAAKKAVEEVGIPTAKINERGGLTVWQRLEYLVDPGTWQPLHSLYNPEDNEEGTTNVVDGLGKIGGRWAVIIGFDNKVLAGAWIAGQPDNILRVTNLAKRLHIPLVWLVNCSGVKLPDQEKFYADRRGSGAPFFRHAELEQAGIPVLAGIYGTNPAGGGYQAISPTILIAHKDANIAVGGVGIVSGMSPQGGFDVAGLEQLIAVTRNMKDKPPGSASTHYDATGFFTRVYDEEKGVLDGIKEYMRMIPAYDPKFFRVAEPAEPQLPADRPLPPAAVQPEIGLLLRRHPRAPGRWQRAHGVPARLRAGGVHRPGEDRRHAGRRHRQPAGPAAQGLSGVRGLPGHRRQALPPGPDQDERVRDPCAPATGCR